jgi:hypothetical protein
VSVLGGRSTDRARTRSVWYGAVRERLPTCRVWRPTPPRLARPEPLLSVEELSEYLNVPIRTLYDWRLAGKGACPIHVGRQLRYFVNDVHDWLREQCELEPGRWSDGGDSPCVGHAPRSRR